MKCKHGKKTVKLCKKNKLELGELEAKKVKACKIVADKIVANEIKTKILNGYRVAAPTFTIQGFHKRLCDYDPDVICDPPFRGLSRTRDVPLPIFLPFPEDGIFKHNVEMFMGKTLLDYSANTNPNELVGISAAINYTPTIRNTSDKDIIINFSCYLMITYDIDIDTTHGPVKVFSYKNIPVIPDSPINTGWGYVTTGVYIPDSCLPEPSIFKFSTFVSGISSVDEHEQDIVTSFNIRPSRRLTSKAGETNVISYNTIINNGFFVNPFSINPFPQNCLESGDYLYYDETIDRLGTHFNDDGTLSQIDGTYKYNIFNIDRVVMQMELDDIDDAKFLSIVVGDTDPQNVDHHIQITQPIYPIVRGSGN